ncbi:MAG: hypothetical protein L6R39_005747 [Caloplaca ligustica]|nr:MAG: hypothetical protein L6R39_005747 [Caloplaca ligustica]
MCCTTDILLALLAVLFPPIAVWCKSGLCSVDSLINILLCMLGYIPGLLHAWYIIAKYPGPSSSEYEDLEGAPQQGHVTYYYVSDRRGSGSGDVVGSPQRQQYPGYGAVGSMRVPAQPKPHTEAQAQGQAQGQQAGEGSSQGQVPPSYEQAVAGDNKVQT